jgi:hypothetical protein
MRKNAGFGENAKRLDGNKSSFNRKRALGRESAIPSKRMVLWQREAGICADSRLALSSSKAGLFQLEVNAAILLPAVLVVVSTLRTILAVGDRA